MSSNGQWRMQWSDNGMRVDVTLHGTIAFTDDLTDVQSLSDGGISSMRTWQLNARALEPRLQMCRS